ncbi:MAG TPA: hypothetical protein VF069_07045 [Streptosporangiaceae bacterium]
MPATRELRINERFCGPPGAAQGGVACGSFAALLGPAAEVTLRRPVPMGRPLAARRDGACGWVVEDGNVVVGAVRPAAPAELAVPAAVTLPEARAAEGRARYFDEPAFPGCFGCGPARRPGDGLRIFPGPVNGAVNGGASMVAAPWTPDASVSDADGRVWPEVVWAALDCPSGIAAAEAYDIPRDTAILLGRMTGGVAARPRAGDPCRLVAWADGRDGRKLYARAALLGPGDDVLAAVRTVWITVPRTTGTPS